MPRLPIAAIPALLVGLLAGPNALAQDTPKAEPPGDTAPAPADSPAKAKIVIEEPATKASAEIGASTTFIYRRANEAQPKIQAEPPSRILYRQLDSVALSRAMAARSDPLQTVFGLGLADADDTLRAQLEIAGGQGVVVVSLKGDGLADQAGLRINDVMLSVGDQAAKSSEQVRNTLLRLGQEALEVKLIRQGKPTQLSLVGPKHGAGFERPDYWIGVPVSPVDATLRAHLTTLAADSGLVANDVVPGSPADKAGVRKNDVLVTLGGKPLKDSPALVEQVRASEGKPVLLEIVRAGKPMPVTITPEKRSGTITLMRNFNVQAPVRLTYDVVRPNMAILERDATPAGPGSAAVAPRKLVDEVAKELEFKVQSLSNRDPVLARIEDQLKGVQADVEKLSRSLEGLKQLNRIANDLDELIKKSAAK